MVLVFEKYVIQIHSIELVFSYLNFFYLFYDEHICDVIDIKIFLHFRSFDISLIFDFVFIMKT